MKAITVVPSKPDQVQVSDLPDPPPELGTLLVRGHLLGICGTDVNLVENGYGRPPPGDLGVTPDVVIECTGISSVTRTVSVGLDEVNKTMVLENTVLFGSVNAGRRHYHQAADSLAKADLDWLERMITRRAPMEGCAAALHKKQEDVKVAVDLTA